MVDGGAASAGAGAGAAVAPVPHVRLHYALDDAGPQHAAPLGNELFDLLAALQREGSIQRAAAARGASYRHVWGALKRWEQRLGAALVTWTQGHPATLTPWAERLLSGERRAQARCAPQLEAVRAELARALAEAAGGPMATRAVAGSPEPVFGLLREHAAARHQLHLALHVDVDAGALQSLAAGRCDIAALHRPPSPSPFDADIDRLLHDGTHRMLCRVRRQQGLMVAPGNPQELQVLAALARPGLRCVLRPPGSGTQALLEQQLRQQGLGLDRLDVSAVEPSHEAAAVAVACGAGDVALGTEAAACAAGLDFVPLLQDDWLLLAATAPLAAPAGAALERALRDPAWRAAVLALPGHSFGDS